MRIASRNFQWRSWLWRPAMGRVGGLMCANTVWVRTPASSCPNKAKPLHLNVLHMPTRATRTIKPYSLCGDWFTGIFKSWFKQELCPGTCKRHKHFSCVMRTKNKDVNPLKRSSKPFWAIHPVDMILLAKIAMATTASCCHRFEIIQRQNLGPKKAPTSFQLPCVRNDVLERNELTERT